MIYRLCFLVVFVFLYSCKNEVLFAKYKSLPMVWHKDSVVKFNFQINKNSNRYNTYIKLRVNDEYLFNNIFLIVDLYNSKSERIIDTLEYSMANIEGELIGKKLIGITENKLIHKEDLSLIEDLEYEISIRHAMRVINKTEGIELLEGILDVGYSIEEINKQ
tara:strand:+ start:1081 stop:1566 length:486 start_codon:yes stop_codon:yes gene_type:complete